MTSKYIKISNPTPHVLLLELNRQPVNAFNTEREYGRTFDALSTHPDDIRAVVLSSAFPKVFSAGIDFQGLINLDPARRALLIRNDILDIQHAVSAPERCPIPVIAAAHGLVIGLGIDIISACDVRYTASDAKFSIKALDMGLAADAGTLAYLQNITGNKSLVHELAYTARMFSSDEAEKLGLVSRVVQGGRDAVVAAALQLARDIASKSPVAVSGTKRLLLHARDHSVAENLEYTATWNSAALQAMDLQQSVKAGMAKSKESPKFLPLRPKL
ncbi:ClpP/crotonase-like domain-containing protein [Suillus fuscotomentosus]|uniref:ClpP/crotonase-like domain-containing protein n=1 Tax=Suillus fuscotomentosus TaxID=1912939 RepID=A0AAD4DZ11_9AGAM|nr:ClpP/crotonase-like domain-containing protein [Suillus fuscotomentosus]KAG1896146.1 ClpP/crotonase-like domain-containing protein [Suillus fuscotomentosus]